MSTPTPGTQEWLNLVVEDIIDPARRIIDPHHHLWRRAGRRYLVENLWADTDSGHNIVKTVFIECHTEYRNDGPGHLKCLGETEFAVGQAAQSAAGGSGKPSVAAIVAHADLTRGKEVVEVLQAHQELGKGLFRGIRQVGACDAHPEALMIPGPASEGLLLREDFRAGMKILGDMGLSYDTWHYHHQNRDFVELAGAVPNTQMILDHLGTPLGVGRFAGKREEIFEQWKKDIKEIAACDNVVAKLGGLAMPDNGFGWHTRERPPSSDEFVEAQRRYYLHAIECFGPDRCMFESNFPVDRASLSYPVLYNGFKKIVADFSEDEKDAMFYGNAARIYGI
ncbi:amidohydrolase family protein [Kiritimatiellota bacterium B12222]|nr:amidohydrolase family protein [Kiritimatiellota bacterium B12222]